MITYHEFERLQAEVKALHERNALLERAVVAIGDVVEALEIENVNTGVVSPQQVIELRGAVGALAQAVAEEPAR